MALPLSSQRRQPSIRRSVIIYFFPVNDLWHASCPIITFLPSTKRPTPSLRSSRKGNESWTLLKWKIVVRAECGKLAFQRSNHQSHLQRLERARSFFSVNSYWRYNGRGRRRASTRSRRERGRKERNGCSLSHLLSSRITT